jgi:transposase, IS6 family
VYRAVDQDGQVIDVLVSVRRDSDAARRFFRRALKTLTVTPVEVVTDAAAAVYPRVLDELVPAAWHHVERWAINRIEADHGRLKHRLRPMRGLQTDRTATVIIAGLAFVQNLRRGHYELAVDLPAPLRVAAALLNWLRRSDQAGRCEPATSTAAITHRRLHIYEEYWKDGQGPPSCSRNRIGGEPT